MARGLRKENPLVAKAIKALRQKSGRLGFWFKTHGNLFSNGLPDIIGCYKGHFFAFEWKLPGKEVDTLSRLQAENIADIKASGGIAHVVTGINQMLAIVEDTVGWD